jgi:Clustered mitochondria
MEVMTWELQKRYVNTTKRGREEGERNRLFIYSFQAGHELKGLGALISCNIPNLHFPLVCVINYKYSLLLTTFLYQLSSLTNFFIRGYRALVSSHAPISPQSLVFGSDDAVRTRTKKKKKKKKIKDTSSNDI